MRRILPILLVAFTLTTSLAAPASAACPGCVYLPVLTSPSPTILPNHSAFTRSSSSYLHIVGEVQNTTSSPLQYIKVNVGVFNGAQLVATDYTYAITDYLRAGDKTCFDILVDKPAAWTSYQFEPVDFSVVTGTAPNLTLLNMSGLTDSFGDYHTIGQVRNDSGVKVTYVEPIGTLYDAAGTVLDCDYTFVNTTDLDPGQTSAFDMLFLSRESYSNVATYRVQVDGNLP